MNQMIRHQQPQTMSSRDIAELTGKQHSKVLRDIRSMLIEIHGAEHVAKTVPEQYRNRHSEYIREHGDKIMRSMWGDDPNWDHREHRGFEWSRDARGYVSEIRLDRYHTEVLVTGYDVHRRAAVIRRWMQLEQQARQPVDPMQVLSDPAAMRGLLLTYTEKVLALEHELEEQAPKVAAHQRIANTEGALCLREAAKTLQVSPSFLIDYMLERRWLYRVGTKGRLQAFQPRLDRGQLRHKANRDGHLPQVLVTMKGLARLGELIAQEESRGQVIHAHFGAYQRQEALL